MVDPTSLRSLARRHQSVSSSSLSSSSASSSSTSSANHNNLPYLYCDRIYNALATICTSNSNTEDVFHKRMNSSRIDIEHEFGLLSTLFRRLTTKHTWKLMTKGFKPREHLFSIFFMLNIYSCLRGNKTATKYKFQRTDIEDCLDATMNDAYDGDDKDELMYNRLRTQY